MAKTQTYYEILGVKPGAKHNDIGLAYNRLVRATKRDDYVPDLKYETKIKEAFEVLSDLDRRERYDRELASARLKPSFGAKGAVIAVVLIAALGGGIYYFTIYKPAAEAAKPLGKSPQEIAAATTPAVGRLQSIDMTGETREGGVAFVIDSDVMVASCHDINPQALLKVKVNDRVVPARISLTDEVLGLCKLRVEGVGGFPLAMSPAGARPGDIVYGTIVNAVGEVVLKEGRVKAVIPGQRGTTVDATLPPTPGGAPLVDVHGNVVAVATQAEGQDRHVIVPAAWTRAPVPTQKYNYGDSAPEDPKERDVPPELPRQPRAAPSMPNAPGSMSPERVEKLHKAFRPPPNIPPGQDP